MGYEGGARVRTHGTIGHSRGVGVGIESIASASEGGINRVLVTIISVLVASIHLQRCRGGIRPQRLGVG